MESAVIVAYSRDFLLKVKSDAPAIKGSVVTFTADLLEVNGSKAIVGDSSFKWVRSIDWFSFYFFRSIFIPKICSIFIRKFLFNKFLIRRTHVHKINSSD